MREMPRPPCRTAQAQLPGGTMTWRPARQSVSNAPGRRVQYRTRPRVIIPWALPARAVTLSGIDAQHLFKGPDRFVDPPSSIRTAALPFRAWVFPASRASAFSNDPSASSYLVQFEVCVGFSCPRVHLVSAIAQRAVIGIDGLRGNVQGRHRNGLFPPMQGYGKGRSGARGRTRGGPPRHVSGYGGQFPGCTR